MKLVHRGTPGRLPTSSFDLVDDAGDVLGFAQLRHRLPVPVLGLVLAQVGLHVDQAGDVARLDGGGDLGYAWSLTTA